MDDGEALPPDQARLADRVDDLEVCVEALERRVEVLAGGEQPSAEGGPSLVVWSSLSPAEEAAELAKLADWVDWLAERYAASGDWLRPCWWRHGFVVEELAALRTAWRGVYKAGQTATPSAALEWHESAERCRERVRQVIGSGPGCTALTHKPDEPVTADPHWIEERAALEDEPTDLSDQPENGAGVGIPPFRGGIAIRRCDAREGEAPEVRPGLP